MHKFSVLAESKIYPQRIPPSIPHFENASGMQTEGYETYYSYVLSESKKLKLHLTCKVFNNITGEPNFVKFMNGGGGAGGGSQQKMSLVVEQLQYTMLALFGKYCFLQTVLPFFPCPTVASHPLCWWRMFLWGYLPHGLLIFCLC